MNCFFTNYYIVKYLFYSTCIKFVYMLYAYMNVAFVSLFLGFTKHICCIYIVYICYYMLYMCVYVSIRIYLFST